jgi:hypothetical protein
MALFEDHHQALGSKLPVLCYPCLDPTRLDYQHYNNTKKSIKKGHNARLCPLGGGVVMSKLCRIVCMWWWDYVAPSALTLVCLDVIHTGTQYPTHTRIHRRLRAVEFTRHHGTRCESAARRARPFTVPACPLKAASSLALPSCHSQPTLRQLPLTSLASAMQSLKIKGSHSQFPCPAVNSSRLYKPRASLDIPQTGTRKLRLRILWIRVLTLMLVSLMA